MVGYPLEKVSCYSAFTAELFMKDINFTDYTLNRVVDGNIYILKYAQKQHIDNTIEECTINELRTLE